MALIRPTRRELIIGAAALAFPKPAILRAQVVGRPGAYTPFFPANWSNALFVESDEANDCDDVIAIGLAIYHHKLGNLSLVGLNANSPLAASASCIKALLQYSGLAGCPVGAWNGSPGAVGGGTAFTGYASAYAAKIAQRFVPQLNGYGFTPGVANLRMVLAAAPPNSVTLVSIGYFTNLCGLYLSGPDAISPLTGQQLIQQKLAKIVIMGGVYSGGSEPNLNNGSYYSATFLNGVQALASPPPIFGVDYNFGGGIVTTFPTGLSTTNPFYAALSLFGGASRPSWDPTAMMYATGQYNSMFGVQGGGDGINTVTLSTGANAWSNSTAGPYSYLTYASGYSASNFETILTSILAAVCAW